ncbi:MAG TPA: DUF1801 domain-containing protein [Actinomycetota bacterium]|nr:DUF1801 domain-containing protein [Actinomycetota bacterium]
MAAMKKHETVDAYLADVPPKERAILKHIRSTVRSVVPDAQEKISYGMPAFTYHGNLLYYAAAKNHLSLFPGSKSVIKKFSKELTPFDATEGTIRFTVENPLPQTLIKKIAKERAAENRARASKKPTKRRSRA